MSTFIATDGKEYQSDTWYPLPFVVDCPGTNYQAPHKKSMLPVDLDRAHLLRVRRGDGVEFWHPFCNSGTKATHWQLQLSGHYEI